MKPVLGVVIDKNDLTYGPWHGYLTEDNMVWVIDYNCMDSKNYKTLPKSRMTVIGYVKLGEEPFNRELILEWNPTLDPKYFLDLTVEELENIQKAAYDMFDDQSIFYKFANQ